MLIKPPVPITTILFDAGGTLVFPSFDRIARELAATASPADPAALARADARVRFELDRPEVIAATTDGSRFRRYLDALAGAAGLERLPDPVFERLDAYHRVHNLWEDVPAEVPAALERLRRALPDGRGLERQRHRAREARARRPRRLLRAHRRLARGGDREARPANLRPGPRANGRRARPRPRTSATSTTSTWWARRRPASAPSCSTRSICTGTASVPRIRSLAELLR